MLLRKGKAAVYRRKPFTIILKRGIEETVPPVELRIDPGQQNYGDCRGRYRLVNLNLKLVPPLDSRPPQVFIIRK